MRELTIRNVPDWTEDDTVVELRAILKQERDKSTPAKPATTNLGKKKLVELKECYKNLGLGDPENMTRGLLINQIKRHVLGVAGTDSEKSETQNPKGAPEEQKVRFGKHSNLTYKEITESYPKYCEWVITTSEMEDEACPQLHELARYLKKKKDQAMKNPQSSSQNPVKRGASVVEVFKMDVEPEAPAKGSGG